MVDVPIRENHGSPLHRIFKDTENGDDDSVAKMKAAEDALQEKEKQKPSFELSGKLAAETNRVRGAKWLLVVLSAASEDGDDNDNSVTET
ncbi:FHA domain-containing protein DDL [Camellia lanceoleosa]|uniref:FHA domain-containing protein DDL n=1 Tax=Camellia lanceoleosa TaxID=1840588 RepID=A0ACC0I6Z1_9ERIC|nr:FHA domain-containing protein DDL [Camellia lanceoleosa]